MAHLRDKVLQEAQPFVVFLTYILHMKHIYFIILFFFVTIGIAQSSQNASSDISGLKLYPNPVTNGRVHITTSINAPKTILVFDIFGTKIMETKIIGKELNLSDLDSGVYVIRIFEKDKFATRKLIIK